MCCYFFIELNGWAVYSFVVLFGNLNLMIMWESSNMMRGLSNSLLEFSSVTSAFIPNLLYSNSFKGLPYFWGTLPGFKDSISLHPLCLSPPPSSSGFLCNLPQSASSPPPVPFLPSLSTFIPPSHFPDLTWFLLSLPLQIQQDLFKVHFCQGTQITPSSISSHSSEIPLLKPCYLIEVKYKPYMSFYTFWK